MLDVAGTQSDAFAGGVVVVMLVVVVVVVLKDVNQADEVRLCEAKEGLHLCHSRKCERWNSESYLVVSREL